MHYHKPPIREIYYQLAGQLFVNGVPVPKKGLVVSPETIHMAFTGNNNDSLIIIRMINAGVYPLDLLHVRLNRG